MQKEYKEGGWVYILASQRNGTLYTGVSSSLWWRIYRHRENLTQGFTTRYGVKTLVWRRFYPTIQWAIREEKRIKRWRRDWKLKLIEAENPEWRDLWDDFDPPAVWMHDPPPTPPSSSRTAHSDDPGSRKPAAELDPG